MIGYGLITNSQIKKNINYRWKKFFIDFHFSNKFHPKLIPHISNWCPPFLFNTANRNLVPREPGIYLFFVRPDLQIFNEQSYIMYVGYSMNLYNRYGDYLTTYKNSDEPNLFDRRLMLNVWENNLYYTFINLNGLTEANIQRIEEKIIDSLVPPINRDFANAIIKQQVRLNRT